MGTFRWWPFLISLFMVGIGGFALTFAGADYRAAQRMNVSGSEAMATITRANKEPGRRSNDSPSYTVELTWRDKLGGEHRFPPTHISTQFWREITADDVLTVSQTRILYLDDDPGARPIIVADAAERAFQDRIGVGFGVIVMLAGLAGLMWVLFGLRLRIYPTGR